MSPIEREAKILSLAKQVKMTAIKTSRRYPTVAEDDLIQAGWLGAIQAVDHHDPSRGKLNTYAERRIVGSMLDYLRTRSIVSIPKGRRKKMRDEVVQLKNSGTLTEAECLNLDLTINRRVFATVQSLDKYPQVYGYVDQCFARIDDSASLDRLLDLTDLSENEERFLTNFRENGDGVVEVGKSFGWKNNSTQQVYHRIKKKLCAAAAAGCA